MRINAALVVGLSLATCAHAAPPRLLGPPIKASDVVDYSCHVDADCAVKNVGSCCGAYPACVNSSSPTFPETVKVECGKSHTMGTCNIPVVEACACVEGRCSDATGSVVRHD
ncbi:MAG: hypothetical protein ABIW82_15180 [Dokdonella sp.]